jgi:hypothetical protein
MESERIQLISLLPDETPIINSIEKELLFHVKEGEGNTIYIFFLTSRKKTLKNIKWTEIES